MSVNDDGVLADDDIIGELSEDDPIQRAVFIALDEAAAKLDEQGEFEPFLTIVEGDEIHIEEQEGYTDEEIIESARQTVFQMEKVADAYILTYNGYIEMDEGDKDAIIVEYALAGEDEANVIAWVYQQHDEHFHFEEPLYSLGTSPSLFSSVEKTGLGDLDDTPALEDTTALDDLDFEGDDDDDDFDDDDELDFSDIDDLDFETIEFEEGLDDVDSIFDLDDDDEPDDETND
ncbi:MAG: hypothetical protein FWH40_03725 [Coriobacteriia bacterium]|nr:hypothetical protein [Coriobacteriia bacterium]